MADPLFVADRDVLLAAIRLGGAQSGGSAQPVIDQAILKARLAFFRKLGISRVQEIQAIVVSGTADTADELIRLQAEDVEAALVRCELLQTLPVLFGDSAADAGDVFQGEEGYTKQDGRIEDEVRRIKAYVDSSWDILTGDVGFGEDSSEEIRTESTEWDGTVPTGTRVAGNRLFIGGPLQKPDNSAIAYPTSGS